MVVMYALHIMGKIKITYHISYICKSSDVLLNMIRRVSGGENFEGYFLGASGEPSNHCART